MSEESTIILHCASFIFKHVFTFVAYTWSQMMTFLATFSFPAVSFLTRLSILNKSVQSHASSSHLLTFATELHHNLDNLALLVPPQLRNTFFWETFMTVLDKYVHVTCRRVVICFQFCAIFHRPWLAISFYMYIFDTFGHIYFVLTQCKCWDIFHRQSDLHHNCRHIYTG